MSNKKYNKLCKDERWQKLRHKVLERDGFKCTCCGSTENLSVHHVEYEDFIPWNTSMKYLITLCSSCHYKQHSNKNNDYEEFLKKPHMTYDWFNVYKNR